MSRRQHHGRAHAARGPRQDAGRGYRPVRRQLDGVADAESRPAQPFQSALDAAVASPAPFRPPVVSPGHPVAGPGERPLPPRPLQPAPAPLNVEDGATGDHPRNGDGGPGATAPQFRRFIKSRAYVPMHELRRRFGINGMEDEVTPVAVDGGLVYVGLPAREGSLLGELLRAGDVGYELSLDPCTPVVIGVYPMRPVPRH
ncbi:MAG TPA: hypothetical protein VGQ58_01270 [Candidatus Limnocylindrales bacterium]|jgi:hypothetical protein|nr:hypothetical protein [Candidatus Limnocylindrales bacterium]